MLKITTSEIEPNGVVLFSLDLEEGQGEARLSLELALDKGGNVKIFK